MRLAELPFAEIAEGCQDEHVPSGSGRGAVGRCPQETFDLHRRRSLGASHSQRRKAGALSLIASAPQPTTRGASPVPSVLQEET
jgi:hypothetical protein